LILAEVAMFLPPPTFRPLDTAAYATHAGHSYSSSQISGGGQMATSYGLAQNDATYAHVPPHHPPSQEQGHPPCHDRFHRYNPATRVCDCIPGYEKECQGNHAKNSGA
jgi:hypothetical protein